jgi:hypothetical protein
MLLISAMPRQLLPTHCLCLVCQVHFVNSPYFDVISTCVVHVDGIDGIEE